MSSQAYQPGDKFLKGSLQAGLAWDWVPVLEDDGTPYQFPHGVSRYMSKQYSGPAIYRWTVRRQADIVGVYIGETAELRRRIHHYLSPGPRQPTNQRLNHEFTAALQRGFIVTLEVLHFAPFEVAGHLISQAGLEAKALRVLLEHLMLWVYQDAPLINA